MITVMKLDYVTIELYFYLRPFWTLPGSSVLYTSGIFLIKSDFRGVTLGCESAGIAEYIVGEKPGSFPLASTSLYYPSVTPGKC